MASRPRPYERLLAGDNVSEEMKERLTIECIQDVLDETVDHLLRT
ncbi:hypothetical protein Holit_00762 [Hollandina sp. SP2]